MKLANIFDKLDSLFFDNFWTRFDKELLKKVVSHGLRYFHYLLFNIQIQQKKMLGMVACLKRKLFGIHYNEVILHSPDRYNKWDQILFWFNSCLKDVFLKWRLIKFIFSVVPRYSLSYIRKKLQPENIQPGNLLKMVDIMQKIRTTVEKSLTWAFEVRSYQGCQ
jgi:hypothetical protein